MVLVDVDNNVMELSRSEVSEVFMVMDMSRRILPIFSGLVGGGDVL